MPSEYFTALSYPDKQSDTNECKPEYARAANMQGIAIRNQFALSCKLDQNGDYIAKLQKVFVENPIVTVVHHYAVTSGVFGPIAAFIDPEWKLYDETCEKGMVGYANSIPRYGDYGMFIYGNTHHAELVTEHRPTLHRVWRNNHYFHTSTTWELFFRSNSNEMLQLARMFTDNHGSVGQVHYDNKRGYYLGDGTLREGASETKSHKLGAFWHCKGLVPWGGRDYGMDKNDADAGMFGHWVDSSALLFAWILDADRWAKDGYDLWLDNVVFPTSGVRREANSALIQAMDAYEYRPDATTLAAIQGLGKSLSSVDVASQRPGPLWHPTWLSRYHEMFPDDADFNKFIVESADKLGAGIEGISSMALCATAYDITGDEEYLLRHAGSMDIVKKRLYSDAGGEWDNFGLSPGPGGMDQHFMAQWPRFLYTLHNAKIKSMPEVMEPANYFNSYCRFNNNGDIASRATTILVYQPDGDSSTQITADAVTMAGGDIHSTSLHVYDPVGQELITDTRMGFKTRYQRPSGWGVRREQYDLQTVDSGIYKIKYATYQIGMFKKMTGLAECQVLKRDKISTWSELVIYSIKTSKGYLVPRTSGDISLNFTAKGNRNMCHLMLKDKEGTVLIDAHFKPTETMSVTINEQNGPYFLETFGWASSYFNMQITAADIEEPLFYGAGLTDIETVANLYTG